VNSGSPVNSGPPANNGSPVPNGPLARNGSPSSSRLQDTPTDLWSLPQDTATPPAAAEDTLVAAWMGVLAQSGHTPAQPGVVAIPETPPNPGAAKGEALSVPWLKRWPGQRPDSATVTFLFSVTVSAVLGLLLLPLLSQLADHARDGGRAAKSAAPAVVDDRVVVPGTSAACVTMLVKPRPDGVTLNVSGTCFLVG
jgi:hypothetical protein